MNHEQLNNIVKKRLDEVYNRFKKKNEAYSGGEDALNAIKRAGAILDKPVEDALLGMVSKHLVSVIDLADDMVEGKLPTVELLAEKTGDIIVYMTLLEAILIEKLEKTLRGAGDDALPTMGRMIISREVK